LSENWGDPLPRLPGPKTCVCNTNESFEIGELSTIIDWVWRPGFISLEDITSWVSDNKLNIKSYGTFLNL
jgi:hypothetical protein